MKDIRLYSYIITHDNGMSPNPFHRVCTLACCKPRIRKNIGECFKKRENDKFDFWVVGISSLATKENAHKLVYAMRVTKVLTFERYWHEYKEKRPDVLSKEFIKVVGDNLYEPIEIEKKIYQQKLSLHSKDWQSGKFKKDKNNYKTDLSGEYVLISDDFYYFGKNTIDISEQPLYNHYNKRYPPRTKFNFDKKEKEKFIEFIRGFNKPNENSFYPFNKDKIVKNTNKCIKCK